MLNSILIGWYFDTHIFSHKNLKYSINFKNDKLTAIDLKALNTQLIWVNLWIKAYANTLLLLNHFYIYSVI